MQFLLKFSLIFFIINSVMVSCVTYTMEIPMDKALHVAFLPNNMFAIAADKSLIFYDLDNNIETEKRTYEHPVDDIAVNKTRSQLAVSCHGKIEVYDTKTQKCDARFTFLFMESFIPITFNSQKDNQLVMHKFYYNNTSQLTFSNNKLPIKTYKRNQQTRSFITCHPHKKEISYISSKFLGDMQYQCFCLQSIATTEHKGVVVLNNEIDVYASEYQYSPNAEYILINQNRHGLHFQKIEEQPHPLITCDKCTHNLSNLNLQFPSAIFHSSNFFVTLSHKCILKYWNCEDVIDTDIKNTPKPFCSTSLCENSTLNTESLQKRLSFSPDGTLLAVALQDKVLVVPVPAKVIADSFTPELKNSLLLILCTKNNLQKGSA